MPVATDRMEFAPPPPPGQARALALALGAHVLLLLALTWGVQWKRDSENMSAEAELWSSVPQQAAPVESAPPPPAVEPTPPARVINEAEIAIERQKKQAQERRRQEVLERQQKLADQKKQEQDARARQLQEDARREAIRKDTLARMMAQAGGGAPTSQGTAAQSSGPSSSWQGRVKARVKPNIVFTDDVAGNPEAHVEVRTAPDGTILGQPRLVKPSGVRAWDEAVVKALIKTEVLPRDIDGRVYSPVILVLRPKD